MSSRAWLDANAAIALIEGPTHPLHEGALGVFRRVADGDLEVIVTAPMMVELAWYLEHRLNWNRDRCARRMRQLVASDGVIALDRALDHGLRVYAGNRRLDFVDAYLAACAVVVGPAAVVSFERDLNRVNGVTRIGS
jgi:predicted nucleic acid-binding protein